MGIVVGVDTGNTGNEREVVGGYWMDWGWIVGTGRRMRMLKYFVDKYPIEICRLV